MENSYSPVPENEVKSRIDDLRSIITKTDIDGVLLLSTVETFYYSGIGLDGAVFIPKEEEPTHLVKRNIDLARNFSAIKTIKKFGRLSNIFSTLNIDNHSKIALELDILPYSYVKYLESKTNDINISDGSDFLRNKRAIKSRFEI